MDVGLDCAWGKPSASALVAWGAKFLISYVSPDPSKNMTDAYRRMLHANGIDAGIVFENEAGGALKGYGHGMSDGQMARVQATAMGWPNGSVIYAAVDWDATETQQSAIDNYMRGFRDGLGGQYLHGMYAGYWPLKRAFDAGVIAYGWQTYAWSGGHWDTRAQLRQVQNSIDVYGSDCDKNERHAPAGLWLASGGTDTVALSPVVEGNLVQETDAFINGAESVDQVNISTGKTEPKPVKPNVALREIKEATGRLEAAVAQISQPSVELPPDLASAIETAVASEVAPIADMIAALRNDVYDIKRRLVAMGDAVSS